jgi:hypothetical protein
LVVSDRVPCSDTHDADAVPVRFGAFTEFRTVERT